MVQVGKVDKCRRNNFSTYELFVGYWDEEGKKNRNKTGGKGYVY